MNSKEVFGHDTISNNTVNEFRTKQYLSAGPSSQKTFHILGMPHDTVSNITSTIVSYYIFIY